MTRDVVLDLKAKSQAAFEVYKSWLEEIERVKAIAEHAKHNWHRAQDEWLKAEKIHD